MFAQVHTATHITPTQLDDYLAKGWFRMRQTLFTTHFLSFNNHFYSAIWMRANLKQSIIDTKYQELVRRNKKFTIRIKKAELTNQHEALYKLYKTSISFQTSDSLQQLLYGHDAQNHFDTFEINLYDGTKLIAAGYFDMGYQSAAGIASFYHPDYKKYSLGKFLIYSKMEYCRQQQLQYFYPGYVAPGYPLFDYKLSIFQDTLQFFHLPSQSWHRYTDASFSVTPIQTMNTQLRALQEQLKKAGIGSNVWFYRYFDACLDPYFSSYSLLDYPVFLFYNDYINVDFFKMAAYHVGRNEYMILECSCFATMDMYPDDEAIFSDKLLQVEKVLLATPNMSELVAFICK